MTRYAIGLGSNVGNRHDHLIAAIRSMQGDVDSMAASALYETEPVGGPTQEPYLNAVVVVETVLEPVALLDRLQEIERERGRVREERWGPRTLDLDILTADTGPLSTARLVIPHPRARDREFVLRPLCDVWPDAPVAERLTARDALATVDDQGVRLVATTWLD